MKHLKRCHELDIRIKSLHSRELRSIRRSTLRRARREQKQDEAVAARSRHAKVARNGIQRVGSGTGRYERYRDVFKEEFEIVRANYEYRTQVEGLKLSPNGTRGDHPKHDDRQESSDEDTRRLSCNKRS